ncbi:type-F conjugative transfer system pilin chaperone TraQ [Salmonella enterica]|nr:type-F conjugative transfer system pilin chaperone TraQ [Salmonella enterica]
MRKFRIRLPAFEPAGLWVFSLGIWFHIVSRLVRPNPSMAIQLSQILGVSMVLWGGYRIVNHWIAQAQADEKARKKEEGCDED